MYSISEKITPSRTGGAGTLKHTSAIDMLQDCSLLWLESQPAFDKYLKENRFGLFMAFRQTDFLRMPGYGEKISVSTSIFDSKPFMGYRNTCITDALGRPCVMSWSVGVFVNLDTSRIIRADKAIANSIVVDKAADMEYTSKKIDLPAKSFRAFDPLPVRKNDIDRYKHVNNARYIERAMEFLPEDFEVKRIRIEYLRAAKQGDRFFPQALEDGGKYFVVLANASGEPYIVSEFS